MEDFKNKRNKLLASVLRKLGLDRVAANSVDLTETMNDPRLLSLYGRPVIVALPLASARSKILPLRYDERHPFVAALGAGRKDGTFGDLEKTRRVLEAFYERVRPQHPAEWLGWEAPMPPLAGTLCEVVLFARPWHPKAWEGRRGRVTLHRSGQHGLGTAAEHGIQHFGPVSKQKLETESRRLLRVAESIRQKGYRYTLRPDDCVNAELLLNEQGEFRWKVEQGNHRVAAVAALGYAQLPVRIIRVVERANVDLWPMVFRGHCTREQALTAFEAYFEARPVPLVQPWFDWLREQESPGPLSGLDSANCRSGADPFPV